VGLRRITSQVLVLSLLLLPLVARAEEERAVVVFYDGFGTPAKARLWGRVLEDNEHGKAKKSDSWRRKLRRNLSALESDEVPHASLRVKVLGREHPLKADEEGLFSLELKGPLPVDSHPVTATALKGWEGRFRVEQGRLHISPKGPGVMVLSDIDDTVLDTGVTSKRKLIRRALLSSARDLKAFPHAPALYRVWSRAGLPLVFVSGSPINLYSQLRSFLTLTGFPRGPMLLKNLGLSKGSDALKEQQAYKLRRINEALKILPGYRLILVGDSGEKDPEIYQEVLKQHPKMVQGMYIHNVTKADPKAARFAGQVVFKSYKKLAKHLLKQGLLTKAQYKQVKKGK